MKALRVEQAVEGKLYWWYDYELQTGSTHVSPVIFIRSQQFPHEYYDAISVFTFLCCRRLITFHKNYTVYEDDT